MGSRPGSLLAGHQRLLREGGWSLGGNFLAAMGLFVGLRLLTEITPKKIYGTAALLLGVSMLLTLVLGAPILQGVARFYPEAVKRSQLPVLRRAQTILFAAATVLAAGGLAAVAAFAPFPGVSPGAWAGVGAFTVAGIFLAMEKNFFAAARRQRAAVSVDVLRYWLQPLLAACLVWLWGASAGNMVWGMALGALLSGAVLLLPATRREGLEPAAGTEPPRRLLGEILQYALPLILVIPFLWICNLGDRYIAGKLLGLEAAGMYAAGYGLIAQPFLTSGDAVRQFMRPLYFNAVAAGDVRREMRVLLGWFCLTAGIFVVGLICVIALRDLIARLCLASPYRDAAALMPWIALGVALQGLGRVLENVFMAMRKTYWNLIVQGIGAACCVASVFWLTRTYGIEGTARACPIYFGAILILHLGIGLTMRFRSLSGPRGNGKEEGT